MQVWLLVDVFCLQMRGCKAVPTSYKQLNASGQALRLFLLLQALRSPMMHHLVFALAGCVASLAHDPGGPTGSVA
jgi:hypothetical protein